MDTIKKVIILTMIIVIEVIINKIKSKINIPLLSVLNLEKTYF